MIKPRLYVIKEGRRHRLQATEFELDLRQRLDVSTFRAIVIDDDPGWSTLPGRRRRVEMEMSEPGRLRHRFIGLLTKKEPYATNAEGDSFYRIAVVFTTSEYKAIAPRRRR